MKPSSLTPDQTRELLQQELQSICKEYQVSICAVLGGDDFTMILVALKNDPISIAEMLSGVNKLQEFAHVKATDIIFETMKAFFDSQEPS